MPRFPNEVLNGLRSLVPWAVGGYSELDRVGERSLRASGCSRGLEVDAGAPPGLVDTFVRLRHQSPLIVHQDRTGDVSARKLPDFVTTRHLRRLEIYAEFFRPARMEHRLAVGLPAPPGTRRSSSSSPTRGTSPSGSGCFATSYGRTSSTSTRARPRAGWPPARAA
jgi:hypothetical protein